MIRAALVVVALGLVEIAGADAPDAGVAGAEAPNARAHAKSSTTVYLSTAWSPGPMVPIRIGADAAVRFHRRHLAIETRLGFGGAASVTAFGGESAGHAGASVGGAIPIGRRVVLAPMIGYDVFAEWEPHGTTVTVHYATFELPVTIVIDRLVIEPFVQLGIARYLGASDPVLVIGPRLGIAL